MSDKKGAYTRTTHKKALVLRRLWGQAGGHSASIKGLAAVPVSKVLREHQCGTCNREVECGELVLREQDAYGFTTTCDLCANWITVEELL